MTDQPPQAPPSQDASFALLECRFVSTLDLRKMLTVLRATAARRWLWRRAEDEYLTTPSHGALRAEERVRIERDALRDDGYRLSDWYVPAEGIDRAVISRGLREDVLARIPVRAVSEQAAEIPPPRAERECTAYAFSSPLSLEQMGDALRAETGCAWTPTGGDRPVLIAIRPGSEPLQEVRWRLIAVGRDRHALEIQYCGNPFEERFWRTACATALETLLPAIRASHVIDLEEHDLDLRRVSVHRAWAFTSRLGLDDMRDALERAGAGTCQVRDSGWYGDYVSHVASAPYDEVSKLRVFEEEDGTYVLDARFRSEHPEGEQHWIERERWIAGSVLDALEANEVAETEGYD